LGVEGNFGSILICGVVAAISLILALVGGLVVVVGFEEVVWG
jgi:hypothetical protein